MDCMGFDNGSSTWCMGIMVDELEYEGGPEEVTWSSSSR
jgi:hypothetical protein